MSSSNNTNRVKFSHIILALIAISQCSVNISCQDENKNAGKNPQKQIIQVNDTNIEEILGSNNYLLIYYHASWSVDSKRLKRHYQAILPQVPSDANITVAETTSRNKKTVELCEVITFPTICLIESKDLAYKYKGEIDASSILEWLYKKTRKNLHSITSLQQLDIALAKFSSIVTFNYKTKTTDGKYTAEYLSFRNCSESFSELPFYVLDNITLLETIYNIIRRDNNNTVGSFPEVGTDGGSKISVIKNFDDGINFIQSSSIEDFEFSNLYQNIHIYSYPILNGFSNQNYLYILNSRRPFAILLFNETSRYYLDLASNATEIDEASMIEMNTRQAFESAGWKFRRNFFFMVGNFSATGQTTVLLDYAIENHQSPVLILQDYFYSKEIPLRRFKKSNVKVEEIEPFIQSIVEDKAQRYLKSEELLDVNFQDNVYNLVGSTFVDFLIDSSKYKLVLYQRRNCALCMETEPHFRQLAKEFEEKSRSDIKFGIINSQLNDIEDVFIHGNPSIILYKPGDNRSSILKSFVLYDKVKFYKETINEFISENM